MINLWSLLKLEKLQQINITDEVLHSQFYCSTFHTNIANKNYFKFYLLLCLLHHKIFLKNYLKGKRHILFRICSFSTIKENLLGEMC